MNAKQHYDQASLLDQQGNEAEALIHYELAFSEMETLTTEDQKGLMLGLGSTYRWVKRMDDSVKILTDASIRFPNNPEFKVFMAITYMDQGKSKSAISVLVDTLLKESKKTSLLQYERAIREQVEGQQIS